MKTKCQYGLWSSPITPLSLSRSFSFGGLCWDESGALVWMENRSDRAVLMVKPADGQAAHDLNSDYSVRARLGYGGGDFTVVRGVAYFLDADSGRIFAQPLVHGQPRPLTPAFGVAADPSVSPDGRWLLYVHSYENQDSLAVVDVQGKFWPARLAAGKDFYMQPAWRHDSRQVAYISWNHPNMPWDGTTLTLLDLDFPAGSLPVAKGEQVIAGGDEISISQPAYSPDGRWLVYASDESGWWQIYLHDLSSGERRQLTHDLAEHAVPCWVQGVRNHAFSLDSQRIYYLRNQGSFFSLWQVELQSGVCTQVALDPAYTSISQIALSADGRLALVASGGQTPLRVLTLMPGGKAQIVRRATAENLPASIYSTPEAIAFPGLDGGEAYGLYFPPTNPNFESSGAPPLIVNVHGGPTSQAFANFNLRAQFFTSRGYAYLEVNHRGSTGYGRAYRNMLRGAWGIYDVQDAVAGARWLVEQGRVDGGRLVIMGGSAGGFTVLKAVEDYPGFFKAGICLYGISNQFTAATDTHKFEAHYTDSLLGPLPEAAAIYRQRSPLFFADKITDALALFQGDIDQVVPRAQSDEMVAVLQRRGVPHIYHLYPGEGHGFRKAETIIHFYQTVEKFLQQYVLYA